MELKKPVTPDYKVNSKRDATDSIRGYVYQIYQSVLAWVTLKDDEVLFLECAEDFDIYSDQTVISTQVKDLTSKLTLRSTDVVAALNNFWSLQQDNPHHDIKLRFLTTASAGLEKGTPFGPEQKGLEYWCRCQSNRALIPPLREFLTTLQLSPGLKAFLRSSSDEALHTQLLLRINWDLGTKNKYALQLAIEDKLKIHGHYYRTNTYYSCQALAHFLKHVVDILSIKGHKPLSRADFYTVFDTATTESIPKSQLEALRNSSPLQQLADSNDSGSLTRLWSTPYPFGAPLPVVTGALRRHALVDKIYNHLSASRVIFLYGSSGTGKTNLAALLAATSSERWEWGGFRDRRPEYIQETLIRAALEVNTRSQPSFLVLDDLDLSDVANYERELIALIFAITQNNGMVIVTGQKRPPLSLFPALWITSDSEQIIPYFDRQEIHELITLHGLWESDKVTAWSQRIYASTQGHPQLVHARVRTLSNHGWKTTEEDISSPEDIERIRLDARNRLMKMFPSDAARILAYRLSIITGRFRRSLALALSNTPPPVMLPGEIFESLVGPWIEKEGTDLYRISPLLIGAAQNVFADRDVRAIHLNVANSILSQKVLNEDELSGAFWHAYSAKDKELTVHLASLIIKEGEQAMPYLRESMFWFTEVALSPGATVMDDKLSTELILRLLQFRLNASLSQHARALINIQIIEEIVANGRAKNKKNFFSAMAYTLILSNLDVNIPATTVVRMLDNLMDETAETTLDEAFRKSSANIDIPDVRHPSRELFLFQAIRVNGLEDLRELIIALDQLEENKRQMLLALCDSDSDFPNMLIRQACWKDVEAISTNIQESLSVLRFTESKAREWNVKRLSVACYAAIASIYDEYAEAPGDALAALDEADKVFGDDALLVNQRAKVLCRAERYEDALASFSHALLLPGLDKVNYVTSCRDAGIVAAKLNDWACASKFFRQGAETASQSSIQKLMGIGLAADYAVSLWQAKQPKECLSLFADVLDSLAGVDPKEERLAHHLHATIRHAISWIHFAARGYTDESLATPLPGMCSNPHPHENIVDHRLADISSVWELLAMTESHLSLGKTIAQRAQNVTKSGVPIHIRVYRGVLALESMLRDKTFDNLIPVLLDYHAVTHFRVMTEANNADLYAIDAIPKLPADYWNNDAPWILNCQVILAATIINYSSTTPLVLSFSSWHDELAILGHPSTSFSKFIRVLQGEVPETDNLYQLAAAALQSLNLKQPSPDQLWGHTFRLLNASRTVHSLVAQPLESWLTKLWLYACQHQKFGFRAPKIAIPDIEQACRNKSYTGNAKVALILETAIPWLNINLSNTARALLKQTRSGN
ncbi:Uncharacterised protein [Serratia entomophila]|uniref:DUF4297 domain-containing protein n=1 Tax=Serratia entomophila TaxID=42906 RepID=UPI0021774755|nr:DUF4297 domain-containing protein [Serratia entomophila]CAI0974826.1 Uncharacterised protein [Serratia entomophila]CAI1804818.1 Uncharacterised protein [Serratia entomophila]